ncbi:NifU family protein [Mycolicibacterium sp.]|uniref:NifU family protein n=1 Tax=Mycolicibacterium sp. TaxID=2320850 RepID=UPI003D0CE745
MNPSTLADIAGVFDDAMAKLPDLEPLPKKIVNDAVESLNDLHRLALTTLVRRLREDPRGRDLLFELADEPEVALVLTMHGILRPDPVTAAHQALDEVRPALQSHRGDVELVRIEDGIAYVRLIGACNGCSMASVTMRNTVEAALTKGVPGLHGVEVVPDEPGPAVIPLSAVTIPSARADEWRRDGWFPAVAADAVRADRVLAVTVERLPAAAVGVILLRSQGQVRAYLNSCAHQGLPLDDALLDGTEGTLICPWHGLSYDSASGECITLPGAQLEQLPVRIADGTVWVRPDS